MSFLKELKLARTFFIYSFLLIGSIVLILIHKYFSDNLNNWLIFSIWFIVFILSLVFIFRKIPKPILSSIMIAIKQDYKYLLVIFFLAVATRIFILTSYPYVHLGDELRDAGLNALRIFDGTIKDLFDLGSYGGYGNFIPLMSFLFIPLFKNSFLMYIVPTALTGIFSIVFTYVIGRIWQGRKVALIGALFLIGSIYHLHYSRTELLILMDSLIAALLILSVYSAYLFQEGYLLAGLVGGFSFHFYVGTRGIFFIGSAFLFLSQIFELAILKLKIQKKEFSDKLKKLIVCFFIFLIGFFVGIGPSLNKTSWFKAGQGQFIVAEETFQNKPWLEKITSLINDYEKAFLVYTFKPTNDPHDSFNRPLLSFPLNWLLLAGLFYLLMKKKDSRNFLSDLFIAILFLFPVINGVIISSAEITHRLLSIFPFINLAAAYGLISFLDNNISSSLQKKIIIAVVIMLFLGHQLFFYFLKRPTDVRYGVELYKLQSILEYIKANKDFENFVVLLFDEVNNYAEIEMSEPREFYTSPKKVDILFEVEQFREKLEQKNQFGPQNTKFISLYDIPVSLDYSREELITDCTDEGWFPNYYCPLGFYGKYSFYIYD